MEKDGAKSGIMESSKAMIAVLACVALIAGIAFGYFVGTNIYPPAAMKKGDINNISATVESYVTDNFLADYNASAKVYNRTDMGDIILFNISIMSNNNTEMQKAYVYATRDGTYLILDGVVLNLSAPLPKPNVTQTDTPQQPAETQPPKTDKPSVELYVMSFCPYGNLAENTMLPVYNLLKDKVDWKVHYIVSVSGDSVRSLHGQPEVDQNEREVCVLNKYGFDKWWSFTTYVNDNCGSNGACWEAAANASNISSDEISSCVNQTGLSLMKSEADATTAAGAGGSPTLIINGVETSTVYSYGNPEAYKSAICNAFATAPAECDTVLSGNGAAAPSGSCG